MPQQVPTPPRRSQRHICATYESNGRDYLASLIGWRRGELERWLKCDTVKPHLILWYHLCLKDCRRFNTAIEWINTGTAGYFYSPSDLEEDLLLLCLGEGGIEDDSPTSHDTLPTYADEEAVTHNWLTQELWARTAWRIVNDNRAQGQLFERSAIEHPAYAYGLAIDVLCIAFHSMAFRQTESIWKRIILDGADAEVTRSVLKQVELDQQPEGVNVDDTEDAEEQSNAATEESTLIGSDSEFEDPETPATPQTKPNSMGMMSPMAPARNVPKQSPSPARTQFVQSWVTGLSLTPDAAKEQSYIHR